MEASFTPSHPDFVLHLHHEAFGLPSTTIDQYPLVRFPLWRGAAHVFSDGWPC